MTEHRLRELLAERVSDLGPADLGGSAWATARRTRQRRVAWVGTAAAAVLVVVVALLVRPGDQTGSAPPVVDTPGEPTVPLEAERGGRYAGAQVWWAPEAADEVRLPRHMGTSLPSRVDLSADRVVQAIGRAVAVYEVDTDDGVDRFIAVGSDGGSYRLVLPGLEPVIDAQGNRLSPLAPQSLSPDGRYLALRQPGGLGVYDFVDDAWERFDVALGDAGLVSWSTNRKIYVPGSEDGSVPGWLYGVDGTMLERLNGGDAGLAAPLLGDGDEAYGPAAALGPNQAQSQFLASALERDGTSFQGLEGVATRQEDRRSVLVQPGGPGMRFKACCPVVGWFDGPTVLFESRHADARILAWRAGSAVLARVTDIRGWEPGTEVFVSSYAEPGGDPSFPDGS